MVVDELKYQILQQFGFPPTAEQNHAIDVFTEFLASRDSHSVMILRGSAGTGKTALAGAIVGAMKQLRQKVMLLAPTGRAAKVFALNSGNAAYTIHRRIYREKSYQGIDGQFSLNDNMYRDTLFMVDEASMISDSMSDQQGGAAFGSGSLLDDLVHFVYQGANDRMVLIGDKAQLPPVGAEESPALNADMMAGYGLTVYECDLTEVVRQGDGSGILYNATALRNLDFDELICSGEEEVLPKVKFAGFDDIVNMPGNELIEALAGSYSRVGLDETMVVTRSNKRANIYNQGIRNTVLGREDELCVGDMVMIVKNNYYWVEQERAQCKDDAETLAAIPSFLANGDRAEVRRVRNIRQLYGFRFADVTLRFPDYDGWELDATVILDTLVAEAPSLNYEQQQLLYNKVMEDYADIPLKADRMKHLRQDVYFNALQIKFAYAVTCHKAQGGQWAHVYVDQGYMTDDMLSPDYLHWMYTAFTRATEKLYLVNWPKLQTME